MLRRACWGVLLVSILTSITTVIAAQQTIYWKKDHIYNGPGGKEIAVMTPAPSDQTAPTSPSSLGYSSVTATSVQLSWSASTDSGGSGLAGYRVYRQYNSNAALPVGTVAAGTLSFIDQPLKPSTSYTYRLSSADDKRI